MWLNPTHALLLALADPRGPAEFTGGPPSAVALRRLLQLADRHGVLAVVANNFKQLARRSADWWRLQSEPGVWNWVREQMRIRAGLSLAIRRQADELISQLRSAGLPVAILKGRDFADRLYPHPALRPFTDLDLLVPETSLAATREVFKSIRYQPVAAPMKHQSGYGEESWRGPNPAGGMVEIHWNLVNSPSLRRGLSVTYDDLQLETREGRTRPSPAGLVLIAAIHGVASHGLDRLQLLGDLTQAVRQAAGPVDESWLAQALPHTGAGRALATALALAHRIYREPACRQLQERLGIARLAWPGTWLLTRGVVLRAHARRDSFRRQLLREFLKRQ